MTKADDDAPESEDDAGTAGPQNGAQNGGADASDVALALASDNGANDAAAAVTITDGVQFWHKGEHLGRMIRSQQFRHCVEIAALGQERGTADRFVQLFKSQGDYQALRRHGFDDAALGVDRFAADVDAALGTTEVSFWFTYRARIGVRGNNDARAGR